MNAQTHTLPRRSEAGFTLVEALVAIVVLVFGLMAVTNLLLVAASSNTVANQGTAAVTSATQVMDFLKATTYDDARRHAGRHGLRRRPTAARTATTSRSCRPTGTARPSTPGVGTIHTHWYITANADPRLLHIRVRSEGTGALAAARSRAEFTTFRACTDSARRGRMPGGAMTPQEPQTMRHERGFSLVELIVAMTVTLIVSSAIYGLLAAGGNAFRREPEVADRQQNIRAAMDLIARDVFGAGAAMPTFAQVFTRNDPAGACAGAPQQLRADRHDGSGCRRGARGRRRGHGRARDRRAPTSSARTRASAARLRGRQRGPRS